jgi:hypothetical protein
MSACKYINLNISDSYKLQTMMHNMKCTNQCNHKKISDDTIEKFRTDIEKFITILNTLLLNEYSGNKDDKEYDDIINKIVSQCLIGLSLKIVPSDDVSSHFDIAEENPFTYGNIPRNHTMFVESDTHNIGAYIVTVGHAFYEDDNDGGSYYYVYKPNNIDKTPVFFLDDITIFCRNNMCMHNVIYDISNQPKDYTKYWYKQN